MRFNQRSVPVPLLRQVGPPKYKMGRRGDAGTRRLEKPKNQRGGEAEIGGDGNSEENRDTETRRPGD